MAFQPAGECVPPIKSGIFHYQRPAQRIPIPPRLCRKSILRDTPSRYRTNIIIIIFHGIRPHRVSDCSSRLACSSRLSGGSATGIAIRNFTGSLRLILPYRAQQQQATSPLESSSRKRYADRISRHSSYTRMPQLADCGQAAFGYRICDC